MKPDRTHSIVSSRIRLHVNEWGDPAAPPLILQHGGRDHSRSWDDVAAAFAGGYRVIAPDLRGHGDSEWTSDGGYMLADYLYDFVSVMDALDLPPCPIVGHSLGGIVTLRFTAIFPARVTRLVNIEGLGLSPTLQAEADAADQAERFREWFDKRRRMTGWAPKRYPDVAAVAQRLVEADERLTPAMADHLAREGTRPQPDGTVSLKYDPTILAFPPIDISTATQHDFWRKVSCPLLLIYGKQSWASNPAMDGRAAYFPDPRVELFDNAGHWIHHDRQADFIAMVRDFIAG